MNAASRKRVRDIQRNTQRKRQQIYMIRRACALGILLLILILIISGIKSCGSDNKVKGPVVTVIPAVTLAPEGVTASPGPIGNVTRADINQSYYANSCFIGNSVIESMEIYELLDDTEYFARIGLNVSDAAKLAMDNSNVPVIDELNKGKKYNRIFMMFGENELNWPSIDTFKSAYISLIKKAQKYQPTAKIYLMAITPISKTADKEQKEGATKEGILQFNEYIEKIAKETGTIYADVYTALADKDGFLPEGVATDGIHFEKDYYTKCLVFMQNYCN